MNHDVFNHSVVHSIRLNTRDKCEPANVSYRHFTEGINGGVSIEVVKPDLTPGLALIGVYALLFSFYI